MPNPQSVADRSPLLGFTSDNIAGASPEIIQALVNCNAEQANPYGGDNWTGRVQEQLRDLFEHDLDVFLVPTGTAANALCLSAMTPPWGSVFCHPGSHINNDECGAPEFFSHGAKIVTVDGPSCKLDVSSLARAVNVKVGDVHATQPACVSITQATEVGSVYSLDEIAAIGDVCASASVGLHMDGSRFANALVSLGCSPAEMTWKSGVGALSFGATKNGALGVEAIVLFDEKLRATMGYRRKRAGHLLSKMRFLSAQMEAYLANDLWLHNARQANGMAKLLVEGLKQIPAVHLPGEVQANIVFCSLPLAITDGLLRAGFKFYHDRWEPGIVRFVTSFASQEQDIANLLAHIEALAAKSLHKLDELNVAG
ncbi:low specificity L-threonine aldolase [Aquitalea sp. LB_tupeE]|uniref:threonine aldolase family protein n=1 Tax=Aquitalea sp. LB_tupeE TaxID=2748078 RepID=UPI0015B9F491|nr:low specificity L-threonine aldolase [Aquitalea sp. LB_tupeE]NWK80182.1 low specificity L-threonine aldolase [Aquitalea sp. LB_tupeE]